MQPSKNSAKTPTPASSTPSRSSAPSSRSFNKGKSHEDALPRNPPRTADLNGIGPVLAAEAGAGDRAVRAGRRLGSHAAPRRREAPDFMGPASADGEPPGGRGQHRHGGGREVAARRLHAAFGAERE